MSSKEKLFADFPAVSYEAWKEKVVADLKGVDFEKKLVWRTKEGFNVQPMYRKSDIEGMKQTELLPGEFPYIRGTKTNNDWYVRQTIDVEDVSKAKKDISLLLKGSVNSFHFAVPKEKVGASLLEELLEGLDLEKVEVNFSTCIKKSVELVRLFASYVEKKGYDKKKVEGSISFDPIGKKLSCGKEIENSLDLYTEIIEASASLPKFKVLSVNPILFNKAGSYSYQELGFALAWGNDLLEKLSKKGLDVAKVAKKIKFNFGVGSNYFMEIAKFRAARMLWANIVMEHKPQCNNEECTNRTKDGLCRCAGKMRIHAETSSFNMTIYDAYVNLLRSQTEAMSACLAGVDSLEVLPFDASFEEPDDFSKRIARNQQLLLKEEAHFNKVVDPAAGSYYLENLTKSLAEQALKVYESVKGMGGFFEAVKSGYVVNEINRAGNERRLAIASRKESLLGTNQFPNFNERVEEKLLGKAPKSCHCKKEEGAIVLDFSRAASQFEELRRATEQSGKRPKVFMLTIGNLAMRLARSQFSCNFFACAGYEVIDNLGFSSVKEGVDEARKKKADIIVLCSSDEEYATLAPEAFDLVKDEIFVVAGAPACMEDLKAKGISEYIHVRSNVLETLKKYNSMLLNR